MTLKFDCYTAVGGRKVNEDLLLAEKRGGSYLLAAADGLGGEGGGDIASQTVVRELKKAFMQDGFALDKAMLQANLAVLDEQKKSSRKMKSTCAAVLVESDKTTVANIGDSRVYLFRDGSIVFQTRDHSAAQVAVSTGEITPDQIRGHEDRNILTRALGVDDELKVDINVFPNSAYDHILICSDGFWEYVMETDMISMLNSSRSLEKWLRKMRETHDKNAPLKCDNNTAIVAVKR